MSALLRKMWHRLRGCRDVYHTAWFCGCEDAYCAYCPTKTHEVRCPVHGGGVRPMTPHPAVITLPPAYQRREPCPLCRGRIGTTATPLGEARPAQGEAR